MEKNKLEQLLWRAFYAGWCHNQYPLSAPNFDEWFKKELE